MIYEIAFYLKIPIYKLADEMPYEELLGWLAYFDRRPIEWKADDRAYKLMRVQGLKESAQNVFPSLKVIYSPSISTLEPDGKINISNLKNSYMFQKMLLARGGERLDL